jgi:3-hydroxyisobutyrate dehydrogenase
VKTIVAQPQVPFFAYPIFPRSFSMFDSDVLQHSRGFFQDLCMSNTPSQRVAFLGMGLMGTRMSRNLLKAGFGVHVYNRTMSKTQSVVDAGGVAFETPQQACSGVDAVISCVTDSPDVEQVLFGKNGAVLGASTGTLFVDMSTISPQVSEQIGERLTKQGFRFIEAPVTGGTIGAHNGTLSILVGGSAEDFQSAVKYFEVMGKNITHCGPWGAGQGVKLCNQIMGAMNLGMRSDVASPWLKDRPADSC